MNQEQRKYEQALAYLTINCSFTNDLGLFHGRMGVAIFFFYYARVTQNSLYEDFAGHLLDDIYDDIHSDLPINLENGLCGIGWGIEYLIQHGYIKGNSDDILSDIDLKIMEIDPLRLLNVNFRQGLCGIAFYVIARLNSPRDNNNLPFDNRYLNSLKQALSQANFSEDKEIATNTRIIFNNILEGNKIILALPDFLVNPRFNIKEAFDNLSLGLENGLSGFLWHQLKLNNVTNFENELHASKKKNIFLIDEESRATNYGIGTYINQLIDALQATEYNIIRIRLFSETKEIIEIKKQKKVSYLSICKFTNRGYDGICIVKKYYRNVFFVLHPYLKKTLSIFHLNTMLGVPLASLLKEYFPQTPIILTVHYTSWSLSLLGDRKKLLTILKSPNNNKPLYNSVIDEMHLMQFCDKIIAIAQHSYNDLRKIYQVPKGKLYGIPHGIQDTYCPLSTKMREKRRKKYGFLTDEILLTFAGRIDEVKGIYFLSKAFFALAKQFPEIRLVIIGDGDLNLLFSLLKPIWAQVTCTGFVDKPTIYELFSISDIGILPSLHEEFGYVAIEMMMHQIPLIVNKTTGLSELITHEQTGLLVSLKNSCKTKSVCSLKIAIETIIKNKEKRTQIAKAGRIHFLQKYTLDIFRNKMINFYTQLFVSIR